MSAFWLWPYLFAAAVVYGGNWAFRTLARGYTQVRAERAIRFRDRWGRLAERSAR